MTERYRAFRALHADGNFALPNMWDVGGLRRIERMGFKAAAQLSADEGRLPDAPFV